MAIRKTPARKTAVKKPAGAKTRKTTLKKFSWKKHLSETITEYKTFFIVLLVIMGIAFSIGVVRAIFLRGPCNLLDKASLEKDKTVDLNYKLK